MGDRSWIEQGTLDQTGRGLKRTKLNFIHQQFATADGFSRKLLKQQLSIALSTGKSLMNLQIEILDLIHYDEVMSLWKRCEGIGLSDADKRQNIEFYLERNPGLSFIAIDSNVIIGAILAGHDGRRGYIHHLAVAPSHRKQGIGRVLVEKCLCLLKKEGITKCHLFVFQKNRNAISFWETVGWLQRTDIKIISKIF